MVHSWSIQNLNADITKRNRAVIALQQNRAGLIEVLVQLTARGAIDHDVLVDLLAIQRDTDAIAPNCGLGGLPFPRSARGKDRNRFELIKRAVAARGRVLPGKIVDDLDLMAAPEVQAAVAPFGDQVLVANGKILEFILGNQ